MTTHLRLISPTDAGSLATALQRNRDFLAPWDPLRPEFFFTAEGQSSEIAALLDGHSRGDLLPLVVCDFSGALLGRLTLSGISRGPFQSVNLGYWIA